MAFVRISSHRSCERLARALGVEVKDLDWHYTFKDGGKFIKVTDEQLPTARAVKGITLARLTTEPNRCWQ